MKAIIIDDNIEFADILAKKLKIEYE